jgi:hypothetical protein
VFSLFKYHGALEDEEAKSRTRVVHMVEEDMSHTSGSQKDGSVYENN